jgi:hypothetical protein
MSTEPTPKKAVNIALTFRLTVMVPADWDRQMIEFFYNESSHCVATELRELAAADEEAGEGTCVTCWRSDAKLLGDATEEDVEHERSLGRLQEAP